ncbi:unnamed protein product [Hermetia illucens]|uniref:Secreted protein n=1 Tax=Hermetia illucens TaxID=343691 RepID=A0A7R8UUG1_HERIL|nr:unnamed protein product [Hermetia illucens]
MFKLKFIFCLLLLVCASFASPIQGGLDKTVAGQTQSQVQCNGPQCRRAQSGPATPTLPNLPTAPPSADRS